MAVTERFTLDKPRWEPPKIRIADTILQEHSTLITGLSQSSIKEAYVESTATLLIGLMMTTSSPKEYEALMESYQEIYNEEIEKIAGGDREENEKIAATRAWLKLLNKASRHFGKFIKSEGTELCCAVIREKTHDKNGNATIIIDEQDKDNPFEANKKTLVLAREIAKIITTGNLDVTIVIVGEKGAGKSWFALSLAEAVAKELSMIFFGNEEHWREYWNYREDTAIIDDEWIAEVNSKPTAKHHVKVLDDVGFSKGIDSRKWQSKENSETGRRISINRTENGVTIYTTQSHLFIDKKQRILLKYYIEMTGPKSSELGINCASLHRMTLHPRDTDDPVHFPFVYRKDKEDGHTIQYPVLIGGAPSPEIVEWYEPTRAATLERLLNNNGENEGEEKEVVKPETDNDRILKYLIKYPDALSGEVADAVGTTAATVRNSEAWRKRKNGNSKPRSSSTRIDKNSLYDLNTG